MKVFNLMVLTYAVAIIGTAVICETSKAFFGPTVGMFAIVPAFFLGLYSRRLVEKILGYTLIDAMKGGSNDENGKN